MIMWLKRRMSFSYGGILTRDLIIWIAGILLGHYVWH